LRDCFSALNRGDSDATKCDYERRRWATRAIVRQGQVENGRGRRLVRDVRSRRRRAIPPALNAFALPRGLSIKSNALVAGPTEPPPRGKPPALLFGFCEFCLKATLGVGKQL
jgi:hypothetical protein